MSGPGTPPPPPLANLAASKLRPMSSFSRTKASRAPSFAARASCCFSSRSMVRISRSSSSASLALLQLLHPALERAHDALVVGDDLVGVPQRHVGGCLVVAHELRKEHRDR
jgi:hypothetical protein